MYTLFTIHLQSVCCLFECEVEIWPHVCSFALSSLGRASLGCAGNTMGCRCVLLSKVHREELRRGGITQSFAQALVNPAALPPELSSALLRGRFPFVQSACLSKLWANTIPLNNLIGPSKGFWSPSPSFFTEPSFLLLRRKPSFSLLEEIHPKVFPYLCFRPVSSLETQFLLLQSFFFFFFFYFFKSFYFSALSSPSKTVCVCMYGCMDVWCVLILYIASNSPSFLHTLPSRPPAPQPLRKHPLLSCLFFLTIQWGQWGTAPETSREITRLSYIFCWVLKKGRPGRAECEAGVKNRVSGSLVLCLRLQRFYSLQCQKLCSFGFRCFSNPTAAFL